MTKRLLLAAAAAFALTTSVAADPVPGSREWLLRPSAPMVAPTNPYRVGGHQSGAAALTQNEKAGCASLNLAMTIRIDARDMVSENDCALMKQTALAKDSLTYCVGPVIIFYNRARRLPDLERTPVHVRRQIAKACIMLIADAPADKAEVLVDRLVDFD
jgi:hypothetical protein